MQLGRGVFDWSSLFLLLLILCSATEKTMVENHEEHKQTRISRVWEWNHPSNTWWKYSGDHLRFTPLGGSVEQQHVNLLVLAWQAVHATFNVGVVEFRLFLEVQGFLPQAIHVVLQLAQLLLATLPVAALVADVLWRKRRRKMRMSQKRMTILY